MLSFQDFAILNCFPISAYSDLLKFNMKMFVNVARSEIGQLFPQGTRQGHPCALDAFLFFLTLQFKKNKF